MMGSMNSAQQVLSWFAEAAQQRWHDDVRENVYSVSKGVSALAAGIAIDEGLLHLDSSVSELLPDFRLGDGVEQVHLRHLLTMTSGIDFQWFGSQPVPWPDLAGEMLPKAHSRAWHRLPVLRCQHLGRVS